MIKKGKKAVILTTMLSVLSANVPAVPVYADDSNSESPVLDRNVENIVSLSGSNTLAAQTNNGMDNWPESDNPDVLKETDDLVSDKERDSPPGSGDIEQDSSYPKNPHMEEGGNPDSPNENSDLLQEEATGNDNLDSEFQNANDSLVSENQMENNNLNSPVPNETPSSSLGNPYETTNSSTEISKNESIEQSSSQIEGNNGISEDSETVNPNAEVSNTNNISPPNEAEPESPIIKSEKFGFTFNTDTNELTFNGQSSFNTIKNDAGDDVDWLSELTSLLSAKDSNWTADAVKAAVKTITFKMGVKSIADNAFKEYKNLTAINFSIDLEKIGMEAFSGCENLTSIIIPETVTGIGTKAFDGCKLTDVTFKGLAAPENTSEGSKMFLPFGNNPQLAVYVPYDSWGKGYDTQLNSWYALWFLPKIETQKSGETQISLRNFYRDFSFYKQYDTNGNEISSINKIADLPQRNVKYSYILQEKTGNGWTTKIKETYISIPIYGKWETKEVDGTDSDDKNVKIKVPTFTKDGNGTDKYYTIDFAKLKLSISSLAKGIYRFVIKAACSIPNSVFNGETYYMILDEFTWEGSASNKNDNKFDYGQKEENSDKDDNDDSNSDQTTNGNDSDQNNGNTIGSVSTGFSQMQSGWNLGQGNMNPIVFTVDGTQSNNSTSESILADSLENDNDTKQKAKDSTDKSDDSDTVGVAAKGLGLFNGSTNVVLVSFISILFIVRALMLIIKKRKIDTM